MKPSKSGKRRSKKGINLQRDGGGQAYLQSSEKTEKNTGNQTWRQNIRFTTHEKEKREETDKGKWEDVASNL